MACAANYRRVGEAVLTIVATGAMFYFGNGLNPLWPLMWIAPLPVLVFALRSEWWATAMVTVAAMLLGNLNMWSYLTKTLGMPVSAWFDLSELQKVAENIQVGRVDFGEHSGKFLARKWRRHETPHHHGQKLTGRLVGSASSASHKC